MKYYSC